MPLLVGTTKPPLTYRSGPWPPSKTVTPPSQLPCGPPVIGVQALPSHDATLESPIAPNPVAKSRGPCPRSPDARPRISPGRPDPAAAQPEPFQEATFVAAVPPAALNSPAA